MKGVNNQSRIDYERYLKDVGFPIDAVLVDADNIQEAIHDNFSVQSGHSRPIPMQVRDLCFLHQTILNSCPISVLEFGSGFSTVIIAHALRFLADNSKDFDFSPVRSFEGFTLNSVEESPYFADITRARLRNCGLNELATIHVSDVYLGQFNGQYCTYYKEIPNISPDLIYLDGPSQFAPENRIDGFSTAATCRMPMAADILRIEFFLEPGTIILVDGRGANVEFLRANFKRKWDYRRIMSLDVHLMQLSAPPLGVHNQIKNDTRAALANKIPRHKFE